MRAPGPNHLTQELDYRACKLGDVPVDFVEATPGIQRQLAMATSK